MINWLLAHFVCLVFSHPPFTSFIYGGESERRIEWVARAMATKGMTVQVQCVCGRRMVDPIWQPWWRQ